MSRRAQGRGAPSLLLDSWGRAAVEGCWADFCSHRPCRRRNKQARASLPGTM
jgi:hypothetical protein